MGVTQLLAGASLMPDFFNQHVNVALLLAPPASMANSPNEMNKFLSEPKMRNFIIEAAEALFVLDIIPYNWYLSEAVDHFCLLLDGKICELIFAFS